MGRTSPFGSATAHTNVVKTIRRSSGRIRNLNHCRFETVESIDIIGTHFSECDKDFYIQFNDDVLVQN
jgi:hypothetical protein